MEYKDYYKTLGVERTATHDEIKRAYKKLARKFHPDVSKEADAETRFKEINEAYQVLKDEKKRKAYDQLGNQWQQGQEFHAPPGWESHFDFAGAEGLGGFSDFFESLFGGGRGGFHYQSREFRMRGEDLHASLTISLEDAFHGSTRTLSLDTPEIDRQSGHVTHRQHQLNVRIPKGVRNGQQIRLAGQGAAGIGGGQRGDLYLEVHIDPHPLYQLDGRDVLLELSITPWEAALGTRLPVPTLGGKVQMTIPAGSQSGQRLRLKGRGLPGRSTGDQFVILRIVTPPANTEAAKAFYRRMAEEMPFNPRTQRGV